MSDFENEIVSSESVAEESVNSESVNSESVEQNPVEFVRSKAPQELVQFVPLKGFDDYEILNQYLFTIRRKDNHHEVKESVESNGYIRVNLNRKKYYKHRLIALQFLPNPDNLEQVDHKSRDRTDYHLNNLRFVSASTNQRNKSSNQNVTYEFVKEIPADSTVVNDYGNHQFEDYYFHDDVFYFFNGIEYRKLHVNEKKNGAKYVNMMNTDNKRVRVYYSKFKRLYNLI